MKQTFIKSAMLLLLILSTAATRAQEVALKTNLLGWASTSANARIQMVHLPEVWRSFLRNSCLRR